MPHSRRFPVAALALSVLLASGAAAQSTALVGGSLPSVLAIPDAPIGGTCSTPNPGSPVAPVVTVGPGLPSVTSIKFWVTMQHTWYSDVMLTVSHGSDSVILMSQASGCGDSSDLNGTYVFSDSAVSTLDDAATAAAAVVPAGEYRGDNPLTPFLGSDPAGDWTFTFQDRLDADTGTVSELYVEINAGGTWYWIGQPFGAGSPLQINHQGGTSNAIYLHAAVAGTGNIPNGAFYGVDIPQSLILDQISFGAPFWGTLDSIGRHLSQDTSLPPGFVLSTVALEVDPVTLTVISVSPPLTVTVL